MSQAITDVDPSPPTKRKDKQKKLVCPDCWDKLHSQKTQRGNETIVLMVLKECPIDVHMKTSLPSECECNLHSKW